MNPSSLIVALVAQVPDAFPIPRIETMRFAFVPRGGSL